MCYDTNAGVCIQNYPPALGSSYQDFKSNYKDIETKITVRQVNMNFL